jgi:fatty acid desaturase
MKVATQAAVSGGHSHLALLRQLREDLAARGLFKPSLFWTFKLLFWVPAFFISYVLLMVLPVGPLWCLLALLASMAMLTMGFVGHDAGHYALSKKRWVNDVWGQVAMTVICGMCFGYWRWRHNQHHARCQEVGGDPDMQFSVVFSVYPESASWHTALGRFFLRTQKYSFWPLTSLYWTKLRCNAVRDVFKRPHETRVDRFFLPLHWLVLIVAPGLWLGFGPVLLAYITISCISSVMTASVFVPNHIGMPMVAPGAKMSHLEQQVVTSRNVTNAPLLDFYYGGLNSQIEHHLFPRVPHNRYRKMRPHVRAFCEKHGFSYREESLYGALAAVGRHLGEMTAQHKASREQLRAVG